MEQEKIKGIIKEKTDELAAICKKIDDGFDKDTIHAFRVSVKTLRSFLRLLRLHADKPGLKIPKKFKRLYHIAGAIRDAQLEIEQLAGKQCELPHYVDTLHLMLERQKKEWSKHYSKKTLRKLEDRLMNYEYQPLDINTLTTFFNLRITTIDELGKNTSPTDNQVHSIRKQVKDILYTSKLAKKKWKEARETISALPVKQFNGLADEIGDYNDKRFALEHLSSFSSRTLEQEEEHNIKSICRKDGKALKAEKKTIMAKVRTLHFRA